MKAALGKTARDLSWTAVLDGLGRECVNDAAREELSRLEPFERRESALERHGMTREVLRLLAVGEPLPMRRFVVPLELCAALRRGALAGAVQLRDAARLIDVALELRKHLSARAAECPTLLRCWFIEPRLSEVMRSINRSIDDHGEILDAASRALATARGKLKKTRRELKAQQQALLSKYAQALSGQFFAERDGRYVLPVRADAPERVDGLVLGSSGSGGTLYVEPRELTGLCNRMRVDEAKVQQEEEKVLRKLGEELGQVLDELEDAGRVCLDADGLRSVAFWAERHGAIPIELVEPAVLKLDAFRHPLLFSSETSVVPNDVELAAGNCLILSGPNAGGKTVAMKCLGLAVWMAKAGLPLPCRDSSVVGWFDDVFTDIGDEQSLSRSLSTFSAHITNIAAALGGVGSRSLVLLDELASGTDPDEGAALAAALLRAFVGKGAAVCVTTHYEKLKQLGASADGRFRNASVGFDLERLRPTFRLALGVPGASAAFAVALRYGVPEEVVDEARDFMPEGQLQQQRVVEELELERQRLADARELSEEEARLTARLREQLEQERERAYREEQQRLKQKANVLTQEVQEARGLLQQAKKALLDGRVDKEQLRRAEAMVSAAAAPVALQGSVQQALHANAGASEPLTEAELAAGLPVFIPHLQARGEVVDAPNKGSVRVLVGGLRLLVPVDKLVATGKAKKKVGSASGRRSKSTAQPVASTSLVRTSDNTCDLRGERVEAGLAALDAFIDQLLRAGEGAGFVLHGHGTGALKAAVRDHLLNSSFVTGAQPADREDGGDALTVFYLR